MRFNTGYFIAFFLASMPLAIGFNASAASEGFKRWEIGLYGGGHPAGENLNRGTTFFGSTRVNLNDYVSLSLQGGDSLQNVRGIDISNDSVNVPFVEFVPRLYITAPQEGPNSTIWIPRIFLQTGVGRYISGNFYIGKNPPSYIETHVNDSWGWLFGGGLDYQLGVHFRVGLDVAYILLRPRVSTSSYSQSSFDTTYVNNVSTFNLDMVRTLLGMRWAF